MPDELLDVVNDTDSVVTQEMRSIVHQIGLLHRGIHVFLVTPEGRLLVQVRGRLQKPFPLALDCSVSEHVKAGENYLQAAQRGLAEELGIRGIHLHPLVKFKMVYSPNDFEICLLYEGWVNLAMVRFDPQEVEQVASYRLEELETLIERGEIAFSSWFVQLLFWYWGKPSVMQVMRIYQPKRLLLPSAKSG